MIVNKDCLAGMREIGDATINCCVTSPPYWGLRDYGHAGQIGLEDTPDAYVARMVEVFHEVKRVLRDDGTLWMNLGDSYVSTPRGNKNGWEGSGLHGISSEKYQETLNSGTARTMDKTKVEGLKQKDLVGIPWRVAFALQADGWYLRQDIIWHKPNPMPESCRDRCTKAHEYIFLLSKSPRYYWKREAMQVPAIHAGRVVKATDPNFAKNAKKGSFGATALGWTTHDTLVKETANRRSVWTVTTKPFKGAHFATFPPDLIRPCILTGCPPDGIVLDPFAGAGTTWLVSMEEGRRFIGFEINPEYCDIATNRVHAAIEKDGMFR